MRVFYPLLFLIYILVTLPVFAQQAAPTDTFNSIKTWSKKTDGVYFSLTQILPEQAQAFYVNRGFSLQQIAEYTASCIFMTVLRNDNAPGSIHFIRKNWSLLVNGHAKTLLSVDDWLKKLSNKNIKKSALIAFRWAQFPPEQQYEPGGDWNQGMLSIDLTAGSQFDITVNWDINGRPYRATLKDVHCAK